MKSLESIQDKVCLCQVCGKHFSRGRNGRSVHVKATHGLSEEEYYNAYFKQDNKCVICSTSIPFGPAIMSRGSKRTGYRKQLSWTLKQEYCSYSCWQMAASKRRYKGGHTEVNGYKVQPLRAFPKRFWFILRPMMGSNGMIKEHRAVMAMKLGRTLCSEETVHHKDGQRSNNDPDNLELWFKNHGSGVRVSDLMCPHCGKAFDAREQAEEIAHG